jgi:hypothetical protein
VTSARAQLNRYREPLLLAVDDLGNRLDNIRNRGFLAYLEVDGPRREAAMLSTLFRVARYFARFEMLYQGVGFLKFERDEDTRAVATRLGAVQHAFVTDRYERFMLWREEQRAIGELMCTAGVDGSMQCAGYARFVEDFDARYARWFAGFQDDLRSAGVEQDERLAELQRTLAELMIELDDQELFVRAGADGPVAPPWVARADR